LERLEAEQNARAQSAVPAVPETTPQVPQVPQVTKAYVIPLIDPAPGAVSLNPPEGAAPPKPEEKKKPGRPKKETSPAMSAPMPVPDTVTVYAREEIPKAVIGTLYVDCIPDSPYQDAAKLLFTDAARRVAEVLGVPHYTLADYGKGQGAFTAAVEHALQGQTYTSVFVDSHTDDGRRALTVLVANAANVVRGLR
jgi:hypothetical protein